MNCAKSILLEYLEATFFTFLLTIIWNSGVKEKSTMWKVVEG